MPKKGAYFQRCLPGKLNPSALLIFIPGVALNALSVRYTTGSYHRPAAQPPVGLLPKGRIAAVAIDVEDRAALTDKRQVGQRLHRMLQLLT